MAKMRLFLRRIGRCLCGIAKLQAPHKSGSEPSSITFAEIRIADTRGRPLRAFAQFSTEYPAQLLHCSH